MARMYGPPTEAQYDKDKWKSKIWKDGLAMLGGAAIGSPLVANLAVLKGCWDTMVWLFHSHKETEAPAAINIQKRI